MEKTEKKIARPVTIKDVATTAGVSPATVSRVINRRGYSSKSSQYRVKQAVKELNYQPNDLARKLKLQRTDIIGLLITDIVNPFYSYLADGILDYIRQMSYHVIVCATDEDETREREYLDVLMQQRAAGIIAIPTGKNLESWEQAINMGMKIVFVDREVPGLTGVDIILVDNVLGAYEAVHYLISLGHTRIGLINGPLSTTTGAGRLTGYLKALAEAGINPDPSLQENVGFMSKEGTEAAHRLLTLPNPPTAIFAANNILAEATIFCLREYNLHIPNDISLVIFDDVPWASLINPPITAVAQPVAALGHLGIERIDQLLKLHGQKTEQFHRKIILSPELIMRSSCTSPSRKVNDKL